MTRVGRHLPLFALLWILAIGGGTAGLYIHDGSACAAATAPTDWPAEWTMKPAPRGVTLLLTLHPHCVCSRATLGELQRILTHGKYGVDARIIFTACRADDLKTNDLWKQAQAIPGVQVLADPDGSMTARLGAKTSGQTYAFGADGKLLFSGGITPARGHMGESAGEDAVDAIITRNQPSCVRSPVFGCSLNQGGN